MNVGGCYGFCCGWVGVVNVMEGGMSLEWDGGSFMSVHTDVTSHTCTESFYMSTRNEEVWFIHSFVIFLPIQMEFFSLF